MNWLTVSLQLDWQDAFMRNDNVVLQWNIDRFRAYRIVSIEFHIFALGYTFYSKSNWITPNMKAFRNECNIDKVESKNSDCEWMNNNFVASFTNLELQMIAIILWLLTLHMLKSKLVNLIIKKNADQDNVAKYYK